MRRRPRRHLRLAAERKVGARGLSLRADRARRLGTHRRQPARQLDLDLQRGAPLEARARRRAEDGGADAHAELELRLVGAALAPLERGARLERDRDHRDAAAVAVDDGQPLVVGVGVEREQPLEVEVRRAELARRRRRRRAVQHEVHVRVLLVGRAQRLAQRRPHRLARLDRDRLVEVERQLALVRPHARRQQALVAEAEQVDVDVHLQRSAEARQRIAQPNCRELRGTSIFSARAVETSDDSSASEWTVIARSGNSMVMICESLELCARPATAVEAPRACAAGWTRRSTGRSRSSAARVQLQQRRVAVVLLRTVALKLAGAIFRAPHPHIHPRCPRSSSSASSSTSRPSS